MVIGLLLVVKVYLYLLVATAIIVGLQLLNLNGQPLGLIVAG